MVKSDWYVYMIRTSKNKLYTGISTDVARRYHEHLARYEKRGSKGARFFASDKPVEVVYVESFENRSEASAREYQIKQFSAVKKRHISAVWLNEKAVDYEGCLP